MPNINIGTTTASFENGKVTGRHEVVLTAEAIQNPATHLPGAVPGPVRELLMAIFLPNADQMQKVKAVLNLGAEVNAAYGAGATLALLIRKDGEGDLVAADFGVQHTRAIIHFLGVAGKQT